MQRRKQFLLGAVLGLAYAGLCMAQSRARPPVYEVLKAEDGTVLRRFEQTRLPALANREIDESSGLVVSRRQPGVLWTHNDSGDVPRLFAFDTNGNHLAVFEIQGAEAVDWEDLSDAPDGLIIADVGDNDKKRTDCTLYRIEEPVIDWVRTPYSDSMPVSETIRFTYEDGPHDCEAVAADPETGDIYLVSKRSRKMPALYVLRRTERGEAGPCIARKLLPLDVRNATAMDFSPDGRHAVVLTYGDAYEFVKEDGMSWPDAFSAKPAELRMPWRAQGESISYAEDPATLYLTSERAPAAFWRVRVLPPSP